MKKLLILLLFIPLVSFGQNNNLKSSYQKKDGRDNGIAGTVWEVSYNNESPEWIYIVGVQPEGSISDYWNKYIIISKRIGQFFGEYGHKRTWSLDGNKIVFKDYERTLSGTINDEGTYISGIGMNTKNGGYWEWEAWRIDKDWVYDD